MDPLAAVQHIYIYIFFIFAVGSISGPHLALCRVNKWSTFSFLAFLCFFFNLLSAGRMRFSKKKKKKTIKLKNQKFQTKF